MIHRIIAKSLAVFGLLYSITSAGMKIPSRRASPHHDRYRSKTHAVTEFAHCVVASVCARDRSDAGRERQRPDHVQVAAQA